MITEKRLVVRIRHIQMLSNGKWKRGEWIKTKFETDSKFKARWREMFGNYSQEYKRWVSDIDLAYKTIK